jgi:hypothetical protein
MYISSSRMFASDNLTTSKNASLTFKSSLADVSKWDMFPFCLQYSSTSFRSTARSDSLAHLEIALAANHNEREAVGVHDSTLADKLPLPVFDVREALLLSDIVDQNAGVGSAVECGANGLELLLAGGVPDLEDDLFVVVGDFVGKEVSADGDSVLIRELAFHVSHDE